MNIRLFKANKDNEMSENNNQLPKPQEESIPEQTPEIPEDALQGLISRFGPGIGELLNAGPHRASMYFLLTIIKSSQIHFSSLV